MPKHAKGLLGCQSCLFTVFETGCLFCWSLLCMLSGWLSRVPCISGDLSVSALHLCERVLESRMCSAVPSFYIGLRDLNSYPRSYVESALAIKQPPQLDFFLNQTKENKILNHLSSPTSVFKSHSLIWEPLRVLILYRWASYLNPVVSH